MKWILVLLLLNAAALADDSHFLSPTNTIWQPPSYWTNRLDGPICDYKYTNIFSDAKGSRTNIFTVTHKWLVETNWNDGYTTRTLMGWTGGSDPNFSTHNQMGSVSSNCFAWTVDSSSNLTVTLARKVHITTLYRSRSYTVKRVRYYSDGTQQVMDTE